MAEEITPKQQAAIRFLVSQDPGLKEEADRLTTISDADKWISAHWRQAMTEGPQYKQLFIPRVYVKTSQEQTQDGRPFEKLRVTIPKGVRLKDGTDIGGTKLTQSLSSQYKKQLDKKGRSITVYIPDDRKVRLYRPGPEPKELYVDPEQLVSAMIRHRDERKEQIQNQTQERTQKNQTQQQESQIEQLAREIRAAREQSERQQQETQAAQQGHVGMTPEDAKQEARAENMFRRVATTMGISSVALQISGTQKIGYMSYRLAVNGQPGTWTPWQSIRRDTDYQSMKQTLTIQATKAGIRTAVVDVTPKALDEAGQKMAENIKKQASITGDGKIHLDKGQLRSLVKEQSRQSELFRPPVTAPDHDQPEQAAPAAQTPAR